MDNSNNNTPNQQPATVPGVADDDANALEQAPSSPSVPSATSNQPNSPNTSEPAPKPRRRSIRERLSSVNIYLLIFVFIIVLALIIIGIAYMQSRKNSVSNVKTQTLTQDDLRKISSTDTTIGSNQTILNVQSSAVFAGKVLIRESLEVAGNLTVGGTLGLTNLTVSGTTQLGQAQVNRNLSVAGDTAVQGATTIAKSLQVNGATNIGGALSAPQITTASLQLSGDLTITKHIVSGGATPGKANGGALGGGGTASVSGSDTAGTVNISTGSGPPAGCFATITFATRYNSTPRVLITPVGASAGSIDYYVNRSTTNFSICTSTAPPAGASFAFDYFVIN